MALKRLLRDPRSSRYVVCASPNGDPDDSWSIRRIVLGPREMKHVSAKGELVPEWIRTKRETSRCTSRDPRDYGQQPNAEAILNLSVVRETRAPWDARAPDAISYIGKADHCRR